MALTYKQAIRIRDNNYRLADSNTQPEDKYNGASFDPIEIDRVIWAFEDKKLLEELRERELHERSE